MYHSLSFLPRSFAPANARTLTSSETRYAETWPNLPISCYEGNAGKENPGGELSIRHGKRESYLWFLP